MDPQIVGKNRVSTELNHSLLETNLMCHLDEVVEVDSEKSITATAIDGSGNFEISNDILSCVA